MTQDETLELLKQCEAARADAAVKGCGVDEAHQAAKAVWNEWAERQIAERRKIEAEGKWKLLDRKAESRIQWFQRHSSVMQGWLLRARADFSRDRFTSNPRPGISSEIRVAGQLIDFREFLFPGEADFTETEFAELAFFDHSIFMGPAWFRASQSNSIDFYYVTFLEQAWFRQAIFPGAGHFGHAIFKKEADFIAIHSRSMFDLSGTHFEYLPNFIQAHFEEAPRIDDLVIVGRVVPLHTQSERDTPKSQWLGYWLAVRVAGGRMRTWPMRAARGFWHRFWSADRSAPSRWRALKRLAIQGHDAERELEFHAREQQSLRFVADWPLPLAFWRRKAWGGYFRFWFGILYEFISDFGRSLVRPFAAWALCVAIFAAYFLGQNPDMAAKRRDLHRHGFFGQAIAYSTVALDQIRNPDASYCYPATQPKPGETKEVANGFSGLVEEVRAQTNLVNEALSIAYHNAVIVLDNSGDSMHRAYGCLYGVERYGGNPVAYVPRNVAIASGIQKVLSAIFIFLFGLALRNMLKVK